ncbi:MAG: hypothetical protein EXR72_24290 [Myxococcales bacterium]|nr:hypothetical protein [Myxococcales bacterium]
MSIRDRGYKPYEGQHTPLAGRWKVVLRHSLRSTAKQPWVVAMLILAVFPILGWGVVMYIAAKQWASMPLEMAAQAGAQDPGQYVYYYFISWYGAPIFAFLMAMFAGGGAIADDTRNGAYQFYFARPISREQYLVGKVVPVVLLVAFVSLGPALLLAIVRVALAKDLADAGHLLVGLPRALALGTLEALVLALPVVALSSLSKGRGYVQGAFATLFMLPWIIGGIFSGITRNPWPAVLSIPANLGSIGAKLYGIDVPPTDYPVPWPIALCVLGGMMIGSLALLRFRLAAAEVVAG